MACYRPTTLKLSHAHCPRALDYYEEQRPYWRDQFAVGVVAHDCLAKVGELANLLQRPPELGEALGAIDKAVRIVMTEGRSFEDTREPPVSAEVAEKGRALAVRYVTERTMSPTAMYERGAAFDASWQSVPYTDPRRRFRLIFDVVDVVEHEGEDFCGRLCLARDYKSSWATDSSELATYQMRAQAVAAYRLYGREVDCIRREVVCLQTLEVYSEDLWIENGGREQIEVWRGEVTRAMDALDMMVQDGRRPARPGPGCMSCPWLKLCPDAAPLLERTELVGDAREGTSLARALSVADATRAEVIPMLKQLTGSGQIADEELAYGWFEAQKREPVPGAAAQAWAAWKDKGGELDVFLQTLAPGVSGLEAVAKRLRPRDRAGQDELLAIWTRSVSRREFGVKKAG